MGSKGAARPPGFTILELLVVVTILTIASLIAIPAFLKMAVRAKLEGVTRQTKVLLQMARQEAVKSGIPVAVECDFAERALVIFGDVDDDGVFTPDETKTYRTVDYQVVRQPLPGANNPSARIEFMGPSGTPGTAGAPGDAISGFTGTNSLAIFEVDGSIREEGAFRFGDKRGNYLEVRVGPAATARLQVRKYTTAGPNGSNCGTDSSDCFYPRAKWNGKPLWVWYQ